MDQIIASSNLILEVDLTKRQFSQFEVTRQDRRLYLGGKGLGLKYLYDRLTPGIDPLSPDNILVFMMGIYMGSKATCSGRFSGLTKSPLTGIIVHSSCGGPFGMALKTAGYEGLIISGSSDAPIYLEIEKGLVKFKEASHLMGMDTPQTQAALEMGKKDGALVIGPAGENLVRFANIASAQRYLGRGGMGAVMGSKNLKAILARGGAYQIIPDDSMMFKKVFTKATKRINNNYYMGFQFRNYGTSTNVRLSNQTGILPVENFQRGNSPLAENVSGERMQEQFNSKPSTCQPCSILCGHKGTYPDGEHKIPEYETNMMLGPNTGNFDPLMIAEWNDLCGNLGMDSISAGGTLAYTMEATQKGLMKTSLKFGSPEGISQMLQDIAYRRGIGADLANGSRWLAQKYGGMDYAIQVKGLEVAAYDPRGAWGQGLSYAVANRGGCHVTAGVFTMETYFKFFDPFSTRAKAKAVRFLEDYISAINSMHTCAFTAYAYILESPLVKLVPLPLIAFFMQYLPDIALSFVNTSVYTSFFQAVSGIHLTRKEFLEVGKRINVLERWMNTREGVSRQDDTLPGRFLNETRECAPDDKPMPLEKMLVEYYHLRRYDEQGVPGKKLLQELKII